MNRGGRVESRRRREPRRHEDTKKGGQNGFLGVLVSWWFHSSRSSRRSLAGVAHENCLYSLLLSSLTLLCLPCEVDDPPVFVLLVANGERLLALGEALHGENGGVVGPRGLGAGLGGGLEVGGRFRRLFFFGGGKQQEGPPRRGSP